MSRYVGVVQSTSVTTIYTQMHVCINVVERLLVRMTFRHAYNTYMDVNCKLLKDGSIFLLSTTTYYDHVR